MTRSVSAVLLLAALAVPASAAEKSGEKASPKSADKPAAKSVAEACDCDCDADAAPTRIFEMRTYITNEGRHAALHKRFREHTIRLFKKHGIEVVGFWTPREEKDGKGSTLVYLLAYPNKEAAEASWKAFGADPEWQKAKTDSHKDGVIVKEVKSVFLEPTDYSPIK